ncbi:MAG: hypothetical protein NC411_10795 [Bacteroides sp.]|nr:hypothetical protein [Bacteroides sp.]
MKYSSPPLPLPELLDLINRYYNCELSDREEMQLREDVATTPYNHPAIDEVRALMGFRMPSALSDNFRRQSAGINRRAMLSIAAMIAVIVTIGIYLVVNPSASVMADGNHCIAYADGQRITDETDVMRLIANDLREFESGVRAMNSTISDELNDIAPIIEAYESPEPLL